MIRRILAAAAVLIVIVSLAGDIPARVELAAGAEAAEHESEATEQETEAEKEQEGEEEEEGEEGPAGADHWFAAQRLYPYTSNPALGAAYGAAQTASVRARAATKAGLAAAWQALGPANIGGRVTDLVVDPVRTDTVYAGAATGGVWRSTNGGQTFTSVWPGTLTPSVGALAITSSGTLYAGTGEGNPGGGSVTFPGNGVYRSTDGGATWARFGSGMPLVNVTDLYVAPDASKVRASTFGRGFWELMP
jgi:hypothetical protein